MNPSAHQPPQLARANGIELCYEIFGDADAEPMLLIMGLGAQMIHWDDDFCRQLAARGFRVIRFDNRDIGQSSKLTGGKRLGAVELLKLRFLKIPVAAPYKLHDMALDVIGLMDALGIQSAHLVGASMGGMIAQELAISFPQRVRSLTSIMSTTGNPKVPPPTREAMAVLMAPPPATKEEYFVRFAQTWKILRVGSFPQDEALDRSRAERTYERGLNPAGVGRQLRAILASGSRKERLASVKVADPGHSRHRRSAGAPRGRPGYRGLDSWRETSDDRRHGPRAADPDVATDHRRHRQACPCSVIQDSTKGDALTRPPLQDEHQRRCLNKTGRRS